MENKLVALAKNLEKDSRNLNDHILIVDGLNTLLRAFAVVNTINPKGNHVGGITGFLKSVGYIMRQFNPTRIVVVWDGKGGSQNRKALNPNYKSQRKLAKVIHWDVFDSKEEEMQSVWDQADRLEDYLNCLPLLSITVDKLEADDVIAYLARCASYKQHKVTVVSSDKDFLQIVDENISIYSPSKKVLYDYEEACRFLQVLPENYNIVKALLGDPSDNLTGVKGLGIKTLIKLFPDLCTDPNCTLDYVFTICEQNLKSKIIYAKILHEWNTVQTNFQLMNLTETVLDSSEKKEVLRSFQFDIPKLRVGPFLHYLEQDHIEGITGNTEEWLSTFRYLQNFTENPKESQES